MADGLGNGDSYQRSGINPYPIYVQQVVLTVFICLIILVIVVAVLHFCTSYRRRQRQRALSSADNTHVVVASSTTDRPPRTAIEALAPSVMAALPSLVYRERTGHDLATAVESECAVCLSNVEEGEIVRVLPNCNHVFHVNCIDAWFGSHSTCPMCRLEVAAAPPPQESSTSVEALQTPADDRTGSPTRAPR